MISDPFLPRVHPRPESRAWTAERLALARAAADAFPAPRSLAKRVVARAVVLGVAGLLALRALGGVLAEPLDAAPPGAPTWNVQVTSSSSTSTIAFAYSRESGMHLLRIPAKSSTGEPRVIPARLAGGDLHLFSLGVSPLHVQGRGPAGSGVRAYSADARAITVFDHADGTGVRTGW